MNTFTILLTLVFNFCQGQQISQTSSLTPAEIVTQKCKEYSQLVNGDQSAGEKRTYSCRTEELQGGKPALPREYPHMAELGYNRDNDSIDHVHWSCGGTLISDRFVLSVAHCAKPRTISSPKWVLLGDLNLNSTKDEATPQVYRIVEIFIHPNYSEKQFYNDIALFKLNTTVIFSPFIRPICLHTSLNTPLTEKATSITGWGKSWSEASKGSRHLIGTAISLLADSVCDAEFKNSLIIDPKSMICAGDIVNGNYSCAGDSGVPLQIPLPGKTCMWTEIGVASVGKGCGTKTPSIYGRVAYYVEWIQSIVWPQAE